MLAVALKMAGDGVGCLLHSLQMVTKRYFLQSLVFEKETNKTYKKNAYKLPAISVRIDVDNF